MAWRAFALAAVVATFAACAGEERAQPPADSSSPVSAPGEPADTSSASAAVAPPNARADVETPPAEEATAPPAARGRPLALVFRGEEVALARVRPMSLSPTAELSLDGAYGPWAFSPDGTAVAVAGFPARLVLARVEPLQRLSEIALGGEDVSVGAVWWPTPRTLNALLYDRHGSTFVSVDPQRARVVARQPLGFVLADSFVELPDGLVALTARRPNAPIGPSTLTVARQGMVRSVALERIRSGSRYPQGEQLAVAELWLPGMALDPEAGRVYVAGAEPYVAEVDLSTLEVTYHEPERETSLLSRLLGWLDPAAEAKAANGPVRRAVWLGDGRVAVAGWDNSGSVGEDGGERVAMAPAGLRIVDTRNWTYRELDDRVGDVVRAGGLLLAYGAGLDSDGGESTGSGLHAYDLDGEERFHLFGHRAVSWLQVASGRAYAVFADSPEVQIVDLATGDLLGSVQAPGGNMPELLDPSVTR
jgi:hypothetical protein